MDFCKYVVSKRWKTDIFNKSEFANIKLIAIHLFFFNSLFILDISGPLDSLLVRKLKHKK